MKKRIFETKQLTAEALALEIAQKISESPAQFYIAVSGGSTPALLFSILSEKYGEKIQWEKVHIFWVDERSVPPEDDQSNYKMTARTLLSRIPIPEANVHRIRGENDASEEAGRYSDEISRFVPMENSIPVFDIILLGIGDDGHTASIFPNQMELLRSSKVCEKAIHPQSGQNRVTLTGKVLNQGKTVYFLVCGKSKSLIIDDIFNHNPRYPASFINNETGDLFFYLDSEAAGKLPYNSPEDLK